MAQGTGECPTEPKRRGGRGACKGLAVENHVLEDLSRFCPSGHGLRDQPEQAALPDGVEMKATFDNDRSQMPAPGHEVISRVRTGSAATVRRLEPFVDAEGAGKPISVSGVVDAILEVSRQRKSLLDQLQSALKSGNDAEALLLARRICGLQE